MNSKNTFTWFLIAAGLFAFIAVYKYFDHSENVAPREIFPGLRPVAVTSVEVIPQNAHEICAETTNGGWILTQPVVYPAQNAAIEALIDALQKLKPSLWISPSELSKIRNPNSEYGFESPSESLVIQSGDERRELLVGNKTPPGDGVYLRVIGLDGVFVTDIGWLKFIPQSANAWRDTALVSSENGCDTITLTNGTKIIELYCDATNHLWRMKSPLPVRANGDYIASILQKLETAKVSQFVTDDSNADLTAFGLQPAQLDLWLGHGSNVLSAIHLGKTNDAEQVFARREGWNTVVTTARQPLLPWFGTANDFRDPYLLELTAPVAEIEMTGPGTNHYVLQRQNDGGWTIPGETFPVDAGTVQSLIQTLANLRVSVFVKDVVTPADLLADGLTTPTRQIILRSTVDDTNAVIAQLFFADRTNQVFVQRGDEDFIYAITPEDFEAVPGGPAWEFRERRIWNFSENEVAQITVRQNGKMLQMIHNGPNQWSLASGSQGIINPPAIEEVAHDLGDMDAYAWIANNIRDPAPFGLKPGNLSITVTLKKGQSFTVDFGTSNGLTALAAVTLDGQRWAFVFTPAVYDLVTSYLAISAKVP